MDDLFVSIQKLTIMKELQAKLLSFGIVNVERWTGETFDHESNPVAQQEGIEKLEIIADSCLLLAKSPLEKSLATLLKGTADLYTKAARDAITNRFLSPLQVRDIVIGEGNLIIVATK